MLLLTLPQWYKDDAIDDVELLQDAGHAGGGELKTKATLMHHICLFQSNVEPRMRLCSHLEGHYAGVGPILVDFIHGSLKGYSLLGQILQIIGALLGFLMSLTHLLEGAGIIS